MAVPLQGVVAMGWAFLMFSFIFVLLRLYVRWYMQCRIALSDGFVVLAWCCFAIINAVSTYIATLQQWSLDFPLFDDPELVYRFIHLNKGITIPYITALYSIKASFALFYVQLFPPSFKKLRIALYGTIVLCVACYLVTMTLEFMMCSSLDLALYQIRGITPYCPPWRYKLYVPWYMGGITQDMATDVLIYILPVFLLPKLKLDWRKLAGLLVTFSLGLVVIACIIPRLIAKKWIDRPTDVSLIITNVQLCAAIIVACLPPLRWLYHSVRYANRTAGRVTIASTSDSSRATTQATNNSVVAGSLPANEKLLSNLTASSDGAIRGSRSRSRSRHRGGIKGGVRSIHVTATSVDSRSASGSGSGRGGGFGGVTWSTWDPDEEDILARFGEYDSTTGAAVPVTVQEEREPVV